MTDRLTVTLVVLFLGGFAVAGLVGMFVLTSRGTALPESVIALIGTALGALGSLLASTRTTPQEPMRVTGPAGPGDPVDTHEVGP